MNEDSRHKANDLLASIVSRARSGEVWQGSVVSLGEELGLSSAIETARAVRALITRGRIVAEGGGYRIVDARPIEMGERTSPRYRTTAARMWTHGHVPAPMPVMRDHYPAQPSGEGSPSTRELLEEIRRLRQEVADLRRNLATERTTSGDA